MGLINKIWSGLDFWDKKENAQQRQQFSQQDEERKRRQAEARAQASAQRQQQQQAQQQAFNQRQQSTPQPQQWKSNPLPHKPGEIVRPNNFLQQTYQQVDTPPPRTPQQIELDNLKNQHMARAIQEEKQRTSRFDRQFTDRNWDKRAEATAINRATREYQDKNGWNADKGVLEYQKGARAKLDEAQKNSKTSQWIAPVLTAGRVGTGLVQGASGLNDLFGPADIAAGAFNALGARDSSAGKYLNKRAAGLSNFSEAATKKAEEQDKLAKDMGVNNLYKTGNVGGEIATYALPALWGTKIAKLANQAPKISKATTFGAGKVDDVARLLDKGGDANGLRRFVAARMRQNLTLEEALQEAMITGRYMGQNTASGGDTSLQSVGLDVAAGFGGAALIPTKGVKNLLGNNPIDDAAGAAISGGARAVDNPPATPPVQQPPSVEVAPGIKSTNLANDNPSTNGVVPNPTPNPMATPTQAPITPTPTQAAPTPAVAPMDNVVPQVNPTPLPTADVPYQAADYQGVDTGLTKPLAQQVPTEQPVPNIVPTSNPIETPTTTKSKQASAPVNVEAATNAAKAPAKAADAELQGKRDSYINERESLAAEGLSTKEVDAKIRALDKQIAAKTAKATPESKALEEGDKQLAEATAKPEINQTEKPSKPSNVTKDHQQVEPPKKKTPPKNGEVKITKAADKTEPEIKTLAESDNGYKGLAKSGLQLKEGTMPDGSKVYTVTETSATGVPKTKAYKTRAGAQKAYDKLAKQQEEVSKPALEKNSGTPTETVYPNGGKVTKEGEGVFLATRPDGTTNKFSKGSDASKWARTTAEGTTETGTVVDKAPKPLPNKPVPAKTVAPEPAKVEAPSKPAPTRKELQKGAAEHINKNGKVNKLWIKAQVKAGASVEDITAAVEKVQGKTVPKVKKEIPTKPVSSGGLPLTGDQGIGQGAETTGKLYKKSSLKVQKEQGKQIVTEQGHRDTFNKLADRLDNLKKDAPEDARALTVEERNAAEELRKKFPAGSAEHNMLSEIIGRVNQDAAQVLSTANRLMRETASGDEIVNRLIDRAVKGKKFNEKDLADLKSLTNRFVQSRDEFNKANAEFEKNPASVEAKDAAKKAHEAKMQANKDQKLAELRLISSNNGDKASKKEMYKLIDKLSKEADVWQMDLIDTSLLSTTGTWNANLINSLFGGAEETLFGKLGSKVAWALTGVDVGGGNAFNLKAQKFGFNRLSRSVQDRKQLPSKWVGGKALNGLKNFVTTMNEVGNVYIDSGAYSAVKNEYGQILKREYPERFGGKMTPEAKSEFKNRLDYLADVDPRDLRQKHIDAGYLTQGMASMRGHGGKSAVSKAENKMANWISSGIRSGDRNPVPKNIADNIGKLIMRVTVGFPTIVARSAEQGMRRTSLGIPTFTQAAFTKDPVQKAMLIKRSVKEAGSGGALIAGGYAAGQAGLITGAYPSDRTTQEEWAKEGKSEWSIKIGKDYYGLPRLLGPFAIPFLVGTQMGDKTNGNGAAWDPNRLKGLANSVASSYYAAMPNDQISDNLQTINDLFNIFSENENKAKAAEKAFVKFGGNMARVGGIPMSGMLNQIAQMTNSNQQDTKQYDNIFEGILNHVYSGVPGVNHILPDKRAKDGTILKNTNPGARVLGASSSENTVGVESNQAEVSQNQNELSPIINDKDIYDLLTPETQELLRKTQDPRQKKPLNDQNFETIRKEVSQTTDKLASEGKWDSYGNTLKIKLSTQEADIKSTEEERAITKREITQAEVLSKNKIKKEVWALYNNSAPKGGITAADFKKMIDPDDDYYDMDTANLLWDLDLLLTEAGVSGNTTGAIDPWTKQKYSMPKPKKGGSGSGSGSGGDKEKPIETDFGTVSNAFAKPSGDGLVQKYQKLQERNSPIPNLTKTSASTNLKKKISVAKGVRL
jgi:hypothetical protein